MEEVYVIRLRGVPSTSTSSSSSSAIDVNALLRGTSLGLGLLHVIFGLLLVVFGALRTTIEHEPAETVFGTLFGPVFVATGISAILSWRRPFRKLKMKVFFCFAAVSLLGSVGFLGLCLFGLVYFHSVPRMFGDTAHITANAIIACVGESAVSLVSVFTAGSAVWKTWRCGAFKPVAMHRHKVIVKTDIVGGQSSEGGGRMIDDEVIRHVSPHCVISLRASDEQREVIKKVEQYLHSQDELSFTFSDPSTLHEEQDLGVDSQNWRNEVLALTMGQNKNPECEDKSSEYGDEKSENINQLESLPADK